MKKPILIFTILLLTTISCTTDTALHREEAETLLQQQITPSQITKTMTGGRSYDHLKSIGWLSWDTQEFGNRYSGGTKRVNFKLSNDAKEFLLDETASYGQPKYTFLVGERRLDSITGISQEPNASTARVQYTIINDHNDIGQKQLRMRNSIIEKIAVFRLFDDGWRIENIDTK